MAVPVAPELNNAAALPLKALRYAVRSAVQPLVTRQSMEPVR